MRCIRSNILCFTLCVSLLFTFFIVSSGVATARTYSTPEFDGENYTWTENSDGTWTEWYQGDGGPVIQGDTISARQYAETGDVFEEAAVRTGTSGNSPSEVAGSTENSETWSSDVESSLKTGEKYKTSGEADIGGDVVTEAVDDGLLPTDVAVAGVLSNVVAVGIAADVGVTIGTGIDELFGMPTLFGVLSGGVEEGHWIYITNWLAKEELAVVSNNSKTEGSDGSPFDCRELRAVGNSDEYITNEGKTCIAVGLFATRQNVWVEDGKEKLERPTEYDGIDTWARVEGFAPGTKDPEESVVHCQSSGSPPYCYSFDYFEQECDIPEGQEVPKGNICLLAFPDGGEEGDTHRSGVATPTIVPSPIKVPTEIPAPARTFIYEEGKEKKLIAPLEPGKELPNPTEPEIPPFQSDELGTDYKAAVEAAGFTDVSIHEVSEADEDPDVGPNDVVSVEPDPGTKADPATEVKVSVNPEDAPVPSETGQGVGPPTEPGFKLPSFGVLCHGFPFGVPCWLAEVISSWSSTSKAPELGLEEIEIDHRKIPAGTFNLAHLEPEMEYIRPAMVIFATIGLVLLFFSFAKGGGPPSGGQGDTTDHNTEVEAN